MIDIKDYFTEASNISCIPNEEYENLSDIIEAIDAMSRTTYRGISVIDCYKQNFLYVSDNNYFLYGFTVGEVKELGFNFYINQMQYNDKQIFEEMDIVVYQFLQNYPVENIKDFTLSYDFYIMDKYCEQKRLVNHQVTPLKLTKEGKVWLALCVTTHPSNKKAGNITIHKKKAEVYWIYDKKNKKWCQISLPKLSDTEKDILKLFIMGFKTDEVASRINRSPEMVKIHRKRIFNKFGTKNILETITFAKNHRLHIY